MVTAADHPPEVVVVGVGRQELVQVGGGAVTEHGDDPCREIYLHQQTRFTLKVAPKKPETFTCFGPLVRPTLQPEGIS